MRYLRVHRKVFLWWGHWWAVQLVTNELFSLGVHLEPRRPLLDLFIGPLTVAVGRHPLLTDPRARYRHSGRGFVYESDPPPGLDDPWL